MKEKKVLEDFDLSDFRFGMTVYHPSVNCGVSPLRLYGIRIDGSDSGISVELMHDNGELDWFPIYGMSTIPIPEYKKRMDARDLANNMRESLYAGNTISVVDIDKLISCIYGFVRGIDNVKSW